MKRLILVLLLVTTVGFAQKMQVFDSAKEYDVSNEAPKLVKIFREINVVTLYPNDNAITIKSGDKTMVLKDVKVTSKSTSPSGVLHIYFLSFNDLKGRVEGIITSDTFAILIGDSMFVFYNDEKI